MPRSVCIAEDMIRTTLSILVWVAGDLVRVAFSRLVCAAVDMVCTALSMFVCVASDMIRTALTRLVCVVEQMVRLSMCLEDIMRRSITSNSWDAHSWSHDTRTVTKVTEHPGLIEGQPSLDLMGKVHTLLLKIAIYPTLPK